MSAKKSASSPVVRFFHSKAFFIGGAILLLLVTYGFGRAFYQDYMVRQEIRELEYRILSTKHENIQSLEFLEYVMSDAFVEQEARRSLNLQEPGERVFIVPSVGSTTLSSTNDQSSTDTHLNNAVKWWYYFIHAEYPYNS